MKQLRAIRILLAALFFAAATACLVFGPQVHPMARAAGQVQIVLSAASITMGATLVWLLITFLLGRVYCSTACPVGTFSDIFLWIRRKIPGLNKPFSYRHPSKWAKHILWIYLLCVIVGISSVCFAIEPWNMARNATATVRPHNISETWATIGFGTATGLAAGLAAALLVAATSLWHGREFCTRWCPVGTMLGLVQEHSLMHIEFDPDKCTSCGKCEERCRAQAIKVVSRYVDDSRCVRCFECTAECPEGAIRYQYNRHRPATPLMRKTKKTV